MTYMVIERFRNRDGAAVYRRFRERGRMMPAGLEYVASWVEPNLDRCFQVVECADSDLLREWAERWSDLIDFEFIPVVAGQEMAQRAAADAHG
jgi:hypothetical protein